MGYDTIFAKSFSRNQQRKLSYGAILCCFLFALSLCTIFDRSFGPIPAVFSNLQLSMSGGLRILRVQEKHVSQEHQVLAQDQEVITSTTNVTMEMVPLCDTTDRRSDICYLNSDVRINGSNSSILITSSRTLAENVSWTIKPYARKGDTTAMGLVREWSISPVRNQEAMPLCTHNHSAPAILFSTGAYSLNNFHDFTDIIVPLFITSREFQGEVHFLITDNRPGWIVKFRKILDNLSRHELIDIDNGEDIHCFPRVIVGLRHHKEMTIDPSKSPYSMGDFRRFLRNAYSLKRESAIKIREEKRKKPRLLIVTRTRTRAFTNVPEIVRMAESLGFEVAAEEADRNMTKTSELVNSCDVMMGVHGAGLTNFVFLPENAVFIQIVPLGGVGYHAKICFGGPAKHMNISYLEYQIMEKESTLIQEYPPDHIIFKNPAAFHKNNWLKFRSVYLEKQNVQLDVYRYRDTLSKALELLY